jgi:hypothetical protein
MPQADYLDHAHRISIEFRSALSKSKLGHLDICCYSRILYIATVPVMSVTKQTMRVGSALYRPFCMLYPSPLPPRHFCRSPAIEFRGLEANCANGRPVLGRTNSGTAMYPYSQTIRAEIRCYVVTIQRVSPWYGAQTLFRGCGGSS